MFKFAARLIISFISNIIALAAAVYFVKGFHVSTVPLNFLEVAAIFTLLNEFLRPILKLVLTPIIVLTFGLGVILVNMLILYILKYITPMVTISGLTALIYATLIIGIVNLLIHFSARKIYKK